MPWEHVTVEQCRQDFVRLALAPDANISQLCARFGISRNTGYKWINVFKGTPGSALSDRSRRPHHSPKQSNSAVEQQVLQLRLQLPGWGGRKIAYKLAKDWDLHVAPSTVTSILHRHGLIAPAASQGAQPWQRFEHDQPNRLWQMDFKGHFPTQAQRCHPLTIIDDHSRYNVLLAACGNERGATVQEQLERVFRRYGLPAQINTDNGPPWGSGGQGELTRLGVWLIRLGIRLSYSRPLHPQTNGKCERFHRTLKAELLANRVFADLDQAQQAFDRWRRLYNHERPHEALGMKTPSDRYRLSPVNMPETLPAVEYGPEDQVRKVQDGGWLSWKGRQFRVGKALQGEHVAVRPTKEVDGRYVLYFCHQCLGSIDLKQFD